MGRIVVKELSDEDYSLKDAVAFDAPGRAIGPGFFNPPEDVVMEKDFG
jgi:hypothetical protein